MVTTVSYDLGAPGEIAEEYACDLCGEYSHDLRPVYGTEVDPTQVDFLACAACRRRMYYGTDDTGAPF